MQQGKIIHYYNRTKEEISKSFQRLRARYGEKVHFGNISPVRGQSLMNNGWFIVNG